MTADFQGSGRRSDRVEHQGTPYTEFAGLYASKAPESMVLREGIPRAPERPSGRVGPRRLEWIDQDLSERERAILLDLDRFRFLTTTQLQILHFRRHQSEAAAARLCRRTLFRLAKLRVIDALARRVGGIRAGSASFIWRVGPVGERLLRTASDAPRARRKEPSTRHLDHALAVADCYVRLRDAASRDRLELLDIQPEPASWRRYLGAGAVPEILKPDLYAVTAGSDYEDHWFVEVDRGTESVPTVMKKCTQYERYRRSGHEQAERGVFPLVVWVTLDDDRAAKLTTALRTARGIDRSLFRVVTAPHFLGLVTGGVS
jgi:hypothetical protein